MIHFQRFRHLFKEASWIVVGQAMFMIGSLVGVRLLTGLLTPDEYGKLSLGITIVVLLCQVLFAPLGKGVTRFYAPAIEAGDLSGYLYAVRDFVNRITIIIIGLMTFGVATLIVMGFSQWASMYTGSLIYASVFGYNFILSGIQQAARQRSVVAIHQGVESWLRFLVATILVGWLGANCTIAMLGFAIGGTIVVASQYIYFQKVMPNHRTWIDNQQIWQEKIWQYAWPMSVFGIFTWGQIVSDRWVLGLFRTTEEVGMYAVLFQLGYYPISMATVMIVQFLEPILFQKAGDGSDAKRNDNVRLLCWRLTLLSLGLTIVAFLTALLLHVQIFQLFVAPEYRKTSYLLPWMVLSGGIFAASQTMTLNLSSQANTYKMMPAKIMTALLGIALNIVGGYYLGTVGIVMASVVFSISCLFSMILVSIPWGNSNT
jgi:O-antigen/teichoic acid export membrane protein